MPVWALRFLPYALGGICVVWLLLLVKSWHDDAQKLPQVEQEFAVYKTGQETAARIRKEVSGEYQGEIASLRANQRPPPAVRLCNNPPAMPSGATGGDHGSSTPEGQLPSGTGTSPVPGRDIGSDLFAIADRADSLAAQLRACQSFVQKLASPPK